ncbi:MAG: MBL fold metallo-hydrolase, partial [Robiginitomaculum sp.]|nr:MBL fold metallo-hydrolase [Robiginitomaculum sp.]
DMNIFPATLLPLTFIALVSCSDATTAKAEPQKSEPVKVDNLPDIVTTDLGHNIYMFKGQGGNIGVSNGPDGLVVIDDQYARMAPKIREALKAINDAPVRFLINTHYHGDHAGGNVLMHEHGADIIAHDNVYTRLSTPTQNKVWDRTVEPMEKAAWPVITYSQNSTLHLNGQIIQLIHTPNAHTDGDSLVYFTPANILHMGDNFFHNMLPYIDVDGGGSVDGMIAAQEKALSMIDSDTKVIPGHGPLATKADLQKTHDMLVDMRDMIQNRMEAGDSIDDILAANPIEKYVEYASFIKPDMMAKIIFRSLSKSP